MNRSLLKLRRDDHTSGDRNAPVVLIEYGDFQCPYCREAEEPLRLIRKTYSEKLLFVFRHFPLTDLHEWAGLAALASEAAAFQGRFWEMHDGLFQRQPRLNPDVIDDLAEEIGLNPEQYFRALQGAACRAHVMRDLHSASELGLAGTPSLFINQMPYVDEIEFSNLKEAVESQLAAKAA